LDYIFRSRGIILSQFLDLKVSNKCKALIKLLFCAANERSVIPYYWLVSTFSSSEVPKTRTNHIKEPSSVYWSALFAEPDCGTSLIGQFNIQFSDWLVQEKFQVSTVIDMWLIGQFLQSFYN